MLSVALSTLVVATSLVLGSVAALTLTWMVYAWRTPEGLAATRFSRGEPTAVRRLRFSLLVPGPARGRGARPHPRRAGRAAAP